MSYKEKIKRKKRLLEALEKVLLDLSPLETYNEGSENLAFFELELLNRCLELHKIISTDMGNNKEV